MSTRKHAAGNPIFAKPGDLITLVSYSLTRDGWLAETHVGTFLTATDTTIRIVEDNHVVELDRAYWLEAIE
ncbi:MAG TPA: hypothetical protein VNQ48_00255 [Microbacteriaceae bacterium]|nr:hypothetical protein [Microbacteriaceae bacterium]